VLSGRTHLAIEVLILKYVCSEVELDTDSLDVVVRGDPVWLMPDYHAALKYLIESPNILRTNDEISIAIWGVVLPRMTVINLLGNLRKKIESDPKRPRLIRNKRGQGYYFASLSDEVLERGRLRMDPASDQVWLSGRFLKLEGAQYRILEGLLRSKEPVRASWLRECAWGDREIDPLNVYIQISQLRRKLGEAATIRNLRGKGYLIVD
jgi:DNA-binding response OmpR family regulator